MARPTKLNADTHKAIVDALTIGATYKDAAESAGVRYHTFLNWMERGSNAKSGKFFKFFNDAEQAMAIARLNYTRTFQKAAIAGDWRAAESFLKRRDPKNWGDKQAIDHTTDGEKIKGYAIISPDNWDEDE